MNLQNSRTFAKNNKNLTALFVREPCSYPLQKWFEFYAYFVEKQAQSHRLQKIFSQAVWFLRQFANSTSVHKVYDTALRLYAS